MKPWYYWMILLVLLVAGWWGCRMAVPVSLTNVFTEPERTWVLKPQDQQVILHYFNLLQTPWVQRRVYPVFPDVDVRC